MWWGVPHEGFMANALLTCAIAILVFHSPLGFLIGILVHLALREVCRVDPHFFRKWTLWMQTKARSTSSMTWGGSRLQPSPLRTRSMKGLKTSV
jgi:type IV secretory pathway VirB3-like protein